MGERGGRLISDGREAESGESRKYSVVPQLFLKRAHSLHDFSLAPGSLKLQLLGSFMVLVKPQLLRERWAAVRGVVLVTNDQHLHRNGNGQV